MTKPKITDVPGLEGYGVTRDGRVFSRVKLGHRDHYNDDWHELTLTWTSQGDKNNRQFYYRVSVRGANWKVHLLIAFVFHGRRPKGQQVRHLDGNVKNNNAKNLKYGTALQNAADSIRHGTTCTGEKHGRSVLTESQVLLIRRLKDSGWKQSKIARHLSIDRHTISDIVCRVTWKYLDK